MSGLLGYFNWDKKKHSTPSAEEQPEKQQPVRALPASWYTSPNMYQFERRAIFADRWLFMTSTLRLPSPNTYVRYQFAGYDILIVRDQDGLIKALHNKSRATKEILIDDTTQEATGIFDASVSTSREDVFPIHVHIDRNGFIWVNLDASSVPSIPFATYFKDVDIQARYAPIDFTNYTLHHIYTLHTSYNWKAAADNFNECYHCPTTHPDIPSFLNLESFDSDLKDGHIQHACAPSAEQIALGVNVHSTYYFPNVSMTVGIHFLMVQKFLPRAADGTTCHYEIFKAKGSSDEEFHRIADMYERVMREDKVLCENAQRNLERGVFEAGLLHPRYEKAPIFFQAGVREAVRGHWERERRAGRSLWPARQPGLEHGAEEEGGKEESRVMGRDEGAEGLGGGVQKEVLVW